MSKCIGGFPNKGDKCPNPAGPYNPHWCDACDRLRMEKITKSLDDMIAKFGNA